MRGGKILLHKEDVLNNNRIPSSFCLVVTLVLCTILVLCYQDLEKEEIYINRYVGYIFKIGESLLKIVFVFTINMGKEKGMGQDKKPAIIKLIISLVTIIAFGGVSIGLAYLVLKSDNEVKTHIVVSGNVEAKLYLKELKQDVFDGEGKITNETIDLSTLKDKDGNYLVPDKEKGVNLENYNGKIFNNVKIVPTMEGSATFYLYNTGSYAFEYSIETSKTAYKADGTLDSSAEILSQVEWTITKPESNQVSVKNGIEITVSYKFNDLSDNNLAADESMDFDILFKLSSVKKY